MVKGLLPLLAASTALLTTTGLVTGSRIPRGEFSDDFPHVDNAGGLSFEPFDEQLQSLRPYKRQAVKNAGHYDGDSNRAIKRRAQRKARRAGRKS